MKAPTQRAAEQVLFRTSNLNLACYLVASNRMTLHHVEGHAKFSEFFFCDPDNCGLAIATEFAKRDLKVSARLLLETRAALLNEIRRGAGATDAAR
jgi:hypothetical protein